MYQRTKWRFLALFTLALGGVSTPAFTHTPYYTIAQKIVLPDGQSGEVRLIYGDGILGPDPVWGIIVASDGRALARTDEARLMTIVCSSQENCFPMDLEKNVVFVPNAASFQGYVHESDRWSLGNGDSSWGFTTRAATFGEVVAGNTRFLIGDPFLISVPFIAAILAGFLIFVRLQIKIKREPLCRLVELLVWVARLALAAAILLLGFLWGIFFVMTVTQWLSVTILGFGLAFAVVYLVRSRRDRAMPVAAP